MDYTFATVIVPDAIVADLRTTLGDGHFPTGLSTTGEAPATHWMGSGAYNNAELEYMVNTPEVSRVIYFGHDYDTALVAEGLMRVAPLVEPD
jgi:hypothetical protein